MKFPSFIPIIGILGVLTGCIIRPNLIEIDPIKNNLPDNNLAQEVSMTITPNMINYDIEIKPTEIIDSCVEASFVKKMAVDSNLLLKKAPSEFLGDSIDNLFYLFNPMTSEVLKILPISNTNPDSFNLVTSPDGKWVAHYQDSIWPIGEVTILNNKGEVEKIFKTHEWSRVIDWYDEDSLLVAKYEKDYPYPLLVVNPFSNSIENVLSVDYPEIFKASPYGMFTWEKYELSETVYNNDFSILIYPENPNSLILWDTKRSIRITNINDISASSRTPVWLPNGEAVIIDLPLDTKHDNGADNKYSKELFSVHKNGEVLQLTNFKTLGYQKVFINRFSLSPDGQNIAIWFAPDNNLPIRLGLYNFMTKKTIVYCAITGSGNKPIWLPNSHQVLIYATMEDQNERNTYIIDTETNTIMQITKNDIPLGWINK